MTMGPYRPVVTVHSFIPVHVLTLKFEIVRQSSPSQFSGNNFQDFETWRGTP